MGSCLISVGFTPEENEQIDVVIKVPEEPRSIIHGIVKDYCDNVIENAVVKLFEVENPCNPCSLKPITHTFTDDCGQFLFGPLTPYKHYVVKVWVNDIKVRRLVIKPGEDGSKDECEHREMGGDIKDQVTSYEEPADRVESSTLSEDDEIVIPSKSAERPVRRSRPGTSGPRGQMQRPGRTMINKERQPE
jgi:hypothetical protein